MKTKSKRRTFLLGCSSLLVAASLNASGQSTFMIGQQIIVESDNSPAGTGINSSVLNLSVNSTYAGYNGTANEINGPNALPVNDPINGTITAYRFWNQSSATVAGTYAQSGTIIGDLTTSGTAIAAFSALKLWETTASNGTAYDTTPDFTSNTMAGSIGLSTGSIDITGITSGSVYFIYGAYRATPSLSVTMTGSGSAGDIEILELHNGDNANNNEYYVARVDFVNDDGFTSIDYSVGETTSRWGGIVVTPKVVDTDAPTPTTAAFLVGPAAVSGSATKISMTAQFGSDISGPVEYLFTETTGDLGATNSAWQTSSSYTDDGLEPSTEYAYTVQMRDIFGNTGTESAAAPATTNAPDTDPPSPNPAQFLVAPAPNGNSAISMTAVTGTDVNPVQYLFTETSGNPGATSSGWQNSPEYTDDGLDASTEYTYTVTMRDTVGNEGTESDPASTITLAPSLSSLTLAESIDLSSQNAPAGSANFNVSVEGAYQGYKGSANDISNALVNVDAAFNNPVTAYRFWNNPTPTTFGTYAQGGTMISDVTTTDAAFQTQNTARLWETTASNGSAFDTTPDYSSNTAIGNLDLGASGSVNITGISEGSVYFFYGAYRALASLSVTMGSLSITELHNGDFSNNNEYYMARVDFVNNTSETSLGWTMASGFNGRLSGIVVTTPGGGGGSAYEDWAADAGNSFLLTLTDPSASLDFDNGGLSTGVEWVVAGDPTDGSDDASVAPVHDNTTDPDFLIFTYRRSDAALADANTAIEVEYGTGLSDWDTAVDDATNVIITASDDGAAVGVDLVQVKLRRSAFAAGGKLFARLNVVVTP